MNRSVATAVVAIVGTILFATGAFAAKPTSATLSVSFSTSSLTAASGTSTVPYGTAYVVSGCGYDAANGGVTVVVRSPEATAFAGQIPDANGCISLTNFTTQGAGSYQLDAYQQVHQKASVVASTSFTLG